LRRKTADNGFPDVDDPALEPRAEPEDPALLAAARMLSDACDRPSPAGDAAAKPGAVVVIISPSKAWAPFLLRALPRVLRGTPLERMAVPSRPGSLPDRWGRSADMPTWRLPSEPHHAREAAEELEESVWSGHGCVCVSHDVELVPEVLREAADAVIEVDEPGAGALLAVSGVCADGPAEWPHGEPQTPLTPGMIRSAFRAGSTVADCHARMRKALPGKAPSAKPVVAENRAWTLDHLRGQPEVAAWGRALAEDLRAWKAGELAWADVAPGCMLVGPPGTGKTSAAQAISGTCGVELIATSFSRWTASGRGYQSDCLKAMRDSFAEAGKKSPCILFIDELDSIPARGTSKEYDDYWRPIVNSMLECLDGVDGREGVVVIGAANDVRGIDSAVLRSGRLDRIIRVDLPDAAALAEILADHLGDGWHPADLGRPARLLLGRSGADAARAVRDAKQTARQARRPVTVDDIVRACRGKPRSEDEVCAAALHEAGHVVVHEAMRPGCVVDVNIVAVNGALGVTRTLQPGEMAEDMERFLVGTLAGRAAEGIVLGGGTAGCGGDPGSDLGVATTLLVRARLSTGLYDRLAWHGDVRSREAAEMMRENSDLARWVEERLLKLSARAEEILEERRPQLMALAGALVERMVLTGDDARVVIGGAGCREAKALEARNEGGPR
jgi:Cdc6-like AAA superfamily ATPase